MVAEGDRVIVFWTCRGTHQGQFFGVSATGRKITVTGISTLKFRNAQIVEYSVRPDTLEIMAQLGSLGQFASRFTKTTGEEPNRGAKSHFTPRSP